jgi:hypothetical protein
VVAVFSAGWLQSFCVLNLYGITVLLVLTEILLLNSIKRPVVCRPKPIHGPWTHDVDMSILGSGGARMQPDALLMPVSLLGCFG